MHYLRFKQVPLPSCSTINSATPQERSSGIAPAIISLQPQLDRVDVEIEQEESIRKLWRLTGYLEN